MSTRLDPRRRENRAKVSELCECEFPEAFSVSAVVYVSLPALKDCEEEEEWMKCVFVEQLWGQITQAKCT